MEKRERSKKVEGGADRKGKGLVEGKFVFSKIPLPSSSSHINWTWEEKRSQDKRKAYERKQQNSLNSIRIDPWPPQLIFLLKRTETKKKCYRGKRPGEEGIKIDEWYQNVIFIAMKGKNSVTDGRRSDRSLRTLARSWDIFLISRIFSRLHIVYRRHGRMVW